MQPLVFKTTRASYRQRQQECCHWPSPMGAAPALCHLWGIPAGSAGSDGPQPPPRGRRAPPGAGRPRWGRRAARLAGMPSQGDAGMGRAARHHAPLPAPFLRERCSLTSDVCLGFCSVKNSFTQELTCRGWRLAVGCAREAFSGRINYSLRPRIFDLRTQINYSSMQETGSQSSKPSILLPETHEKGKFLCSLAITERRYQG